MSLKISRGVFKNYTGSSSIFSNSELVTTTILGPFDTLKKDDNTNELSVDIKIHHFPECKSFENMAVGIVSKILENFVLKDIEKYRAISMSIYTNTYNLSMIGNSVLIACLDCGIPLKNMFYCVGDYDLFIFSSGNIVLQHTVEPINDQKKAKLEKELQYVQECVDLAMQDAFNIE